MSEIEHRTLRKFSLQAGLSQGQARLGKAPGHYLGNSKSIVPDLSSCEHTLMNYLINSTTKKDVDDSSSVLSQLAAINEVLHLVNWASPLRVSQPIRASSGQGRSETITSPSRWLWGKLESVNFINATRKVGGLRIVILSIPLEHLSGQHNIQLPFSNHQRRLRRILLRRLDSSGSRDESTGTLTGT